MRSHLGREDDATSLRTVCMTSSPVFGSRVRGGFAQRSARLFFLAWVAAFASGCAVRAGVVADPLAAPVVFVNRAPLVQRGVAVVSQPRLQVALRANPRRFVQRAERRPATFKRQSAVVRSVRRPAAVQRQRPRAERRRPATAERRRPVTRNAHSAASSDRRRAESSRQQQRRSSRATRGGQRQETDARRDRASRDRGTRVRAD